MEFALTNRRKSTRRFEIEIFRERRLTMRYEEPTSLQIQMTVIIDKLYQPIFVMIMMLKLSLEEKWTIRKTNRKHERAV